MADPSASDIISALADDLPVGIWVARAPGGEFVYANRMFAALMGTDGIAEAAVGGYAEPYGIFTRDGQPYPEHRMPFVRALEEKKVVVVDDLTIHRPDRTRLDVRAFARPVADGAGTITHVVIAFFDISREVELARERALSQQREQRTQRLEAIGTLAGGVAHDFNNLIFGIKLVASELALSASDGRVKSDLELIDNITERAATLTRSLLGFARLGKHRAAPVALEDVIAGMRELLERTLAGVRLDFSFGAEARGVVVGDQAQLEQVVMNLVVNARDAVGGSGRVRVSTRTVPLDAPPPLATGAFTRGTAVVFEVADDGPGIAAPERDRVFEPYFTTKTRGPDRGTGLGLATVLGIVEAHGGSIEIGGGLDGRGTTMRVYLPAGAPVTAAPAPVKSGSPAKGHGTLLVVDDDQIVRKALVSALRKLGYEVIEAASGAQALEHYRERGAQISAVVLDMIMPGLSGRATYLALRELAPGVKVLLMSGYTMNEEVQAILDLGVRSFLSKPYSMEALAHELELLCAG
ncbi:MAG: response regulator [Archangium sp.]|nr:response regulator [Archangium sp.]